MQQPSIIRRVLIADGEAALHGAAISILEKAGVVADYARDLAEARALLAARPYVAMLIDASSIDGDIAELRSLFQQLAEPRPVVVVASSDPVPQFDPALVSLVVRKPYDLQMVIGVLLACGTDAISPVMFDSGQTGFAQ